ncbi:hypothetical protein KC333_g72 [Hortaea werneckii]|nr:hypothetical protein KC333_g72 [Hortaea werneckii]
METKALTLIPSSSSPATVLMSHRDMSHDAFQTRQVLQGPATTVARKIGTSPILLSASSNVEDLALATYTSLHHMHGLYPFRYGQSAGSLVS